MSILYKDIDPEILGYGNSNKQLQTKEQDNLAAAAREKLTDPSKRIEYPDTLSSTDEAGGFMNNYRFLQKSVVDALGNVVDTAGSAINEGIDMYNKVGQGVSQIAGKEDQFKPKSNIDFTGAVGGTQFNRDLMAGLGAPVINRDPMSKSEKLSSDAGENLVLFAPPVKGATVVNSALNAARTGGFFDPDTESISGKPEIDRLKDDPLYIGKTNTPSSTPSYFSDIIDTPSGELDEAATLAMNPNGFPKDAPVATPVATPVADPVATPATPVTPTASPTLPSASSSQAFDMPMTGMRPIDPTTGEPLSQQAIDAANRAGLELPMANVPQAPQAPQSPRDIAVARQEARLQELRNGAGLSDTALVSSADLSGGLSDAAKIATGQMEAPEGFYSPAPMQPAEPPQTTVGDDAISNFAKFKEDLDRQGKYMEQADVTKGDDFAASMGRTFDPEAGYSREFDPYIQDAYNARVESARATESGQDLDPNKPAPKDTPEEAKTQEQIEYEQQVQEDEQGIIDKARERGESQEYIDEMLEGVRKRRREAEAEQSLEDLKNELQIKKMRLENRKLESELNDDGPEEVDIPKVKSLYGMMEDQGVKQDPQTGAITVTKEGWLGDSDNALAPNSSLFQQLARTPEGRYILNTRPPEINSVKDPDPSKLYEADDGRYFNYDGESWSVIVNF